MLKIKFFAVMCAALLLLTGCAPKDDFADYETVEYHPVENVSAATEFEEYDGNAESIAVLLSNNSDNQFELSDSIALEKNVDGEWRAIRIIKKEYTLIYHAVSAHTEEWKRFELKDYVELPLLPGQYRIWVGGGNKVPAEFTIK